MNQNNSKPMTVVEGFIAVIVLVIIVKGEEFIRALSDYISNLLRSLFDVLIVILILVVAVYFLVQFSDSLGEIIVGVAEIALPILIKGIPLLIPIIFISLFNNIVIIALTTLGVTNAYEIVNTASFSSMYWIATYGIIIGFYVWLYKDDLKASINYQ